jgi:5-methylcytosine-specific restriction endonuclease McrA
MRKKWAIKQRIRGQNQRAKQAGARYDLTQEQWLETLGYFNYKCAYCGKRDYEFIEHYLPVHVAGTTVSNCVPACANCNALKDAQNHKLTFYQNEHVLAFLESKQVKIAFHIHEYKATKEEYVILNCEGCRDRIDIPGLQLEDAEQYIQDFYINTGYAYVVPEAN